MHLNGIRKVKIPPDTIKIGIFKKTPIENLAENKRPNSIVIKIDFRIIKKVP